jgi:Tfp pilus assembly protein FimT
MKRSRLNVFKATSMTISVLGVLMIVATVAILAYIGFQSLSSFISSDASTGSANSELASLKTEANALNGQYDTLKIQIDNTNNRNLKIAYVNAELEMVKAQSDISDVESALVANKPNDEVQRRLEVAKVQLQKAKSSYSNLQSQL